MMFAEPKGFTIGESGYQIARPKSSRQLRKRGENCPMS